MMNDPTLFIDSVSDKIRQMKIKNILTAERSNGKK